MEEERDDIVVLLDENGEEVEFEHLDTLELNGNEYVVLMPLEEMEEDEESEEDEDDSDEIIILKIEHGADGEDSFITIEDENELNQVFEEFKQRMEEELGLDDEE